STIQGRMNRPESTACHTDSPIGMPDGGAHPNLNQKMYRNRYASQNTGADTPMSANTMDVRSQTLPRLTAEMIPIGIPIRTQVIAAPTARVIVTGRRLKISSFTGTKFVYE